MKAAAVEYEFEAEGWRREWDEASATTTAAREVTRTEHALEISAKEEAAQGQYAVKHT
jgi:hypothetical protein